MVYYTYELLMTNRLNRLIVETEALNPDLIRDVARRLKRKFLTQRANARYRGIEWRLTFEQWRDWWLATGRVDERGRLRGQWVMCRPGDRGAYELGNIKCALAEDNVTEQNMLRPGEYEVSR
jgi:hypothetical protein